MRYLIAMCKQSSGVDGSRLECAREEDAAIMTLTLYSHPFSSYSQKAKTALYEKDIDYEERLLDGSEPVASEFAGLWPFGKFPILVVDGQLIFDTTTIIEHLDVLRPETSPMIPAEAKVAAEARMWDRFFDNYVSYPQQRFIFGAVGREPRDDARWAGELDKAYAFLDARMARREWAAGEAFSLADCAAAPSLLYAHWTHPIPERFANVLAYRRRLLSRPSYARALDEARPYRHFFPLRAPIESD